jgi:hypothetical protein
LEGVVHRGILGAYTTACRTEYVCEAIKATHILFRLPHYICSYICSYICTIVIKERRENELTILSKLFRGHHDQAAAGHAKKLKTIKMDKSIPSDE